VNNFYEKAIYKPENNFGAADDHRGAGGHKGAAKGESAPGGQAHPGAAFLEGTG
jgi:hypothetical protein